MASVIKKQLLDDFRELLNHQAIKKKEINLFWKDFVNTNLYMEKHL